ncbi:MAG: TetR/AcrR family transcriptional regulator [Gammaproteobacteria bacterium]|nr:TetR/AcrR family transcriptional regulator [Gammaproteobacteria bacterium]
MARRSDHTQEELKDLIINASIKLVTDTGPSAFGTRAIAREIGYSFGTIYHIYGNLENLRYFVKGRIMNNWYGDLTEGMETQNDKIKFLLDAYIDLSIQQRFLWAFVFALPSDDKKRAPSWYMEKVERLFSLVISAFEPITRNRKEAELAARAIWPGIHGICVLAMAHKLEMVTTDKPKTMAHNMLAIYMTGLKNLDGEAEINS